jgi:hypothetical protein
MAETEHIHLWNLPAVAQALFLMAAAPGLSGPKRPRKYRERVENKKI